MDDKTEQSELERIARLLDSRGVEFIVIGGQAEVLHGSPRVTFDVDICYSRTRENLERLAAALTQIKPTLRGAPADLPFKLDARTLEMGMNFTFSTTIIDLDILGYVQPIGSYDDLKKNAELYNAFGMKLWAISLEDLLKVKTTINRAKDQESIAQLRAIKRIRDNPASN